MQGHDFSGKVAAAVMTSVRVHDDFILDRVHFISEQLGFGYAGDVSAVGNPFIGYAEDEEKTEDSCRILAGQFNRALGDGYVPARHYPPVERRYLASTYRGPAFAVDSPPVPKTGDKTILVVTGHRLSEDPADASVVEALQRSSRNNVEVICIAALAQSAADGPAFADAVRRTAAELDRALDEKWQIADRFATRGTAWTFRDLAATSGMMLRADYEFHKKNRMFDAPSPGGMNALLRLLFKNKKLERRLLALNRSRTARTRETRLAAYLQNGRLGKGQETLI